MIQDIGPHSLDNHFVPRKQPSPDSPVICFNGRDVLLRASAVNTVAKPISDEERSIAPTHAETKNAADNLQFLPTYSELPEGTNAHFLFTYDGVDLFRAELSVLDTAHEEPGLEFGIDNLVVVNKAQNEKVMDGFFFGSIKAVRREELLEKNQVFLLMTAFQLNNWYIDNRFCGRCATPTVHSPHERALVCPECHRTIYPRILPAVIVGITYHNHRQDTDKILLTKYAPKTGHAFPYYALVAGFTEIGETLEECVQREVMEETGLCVKNIRYYKSQPWGVVDDLLMGFYCEWDAEAQLEMVADSAMASNLVNDRDASVADISLLDAKGDPVITLDRNELKTGVWLTPEEMTLQPDAYSLTNEMMLLFKSEIVHSPNDLPLPLVRADIAALEKQYYK